jgi:hypothetical protein
MFLQISATVVPAYKITWAVGVAARPKPASRRPRCANAAVVRFPSVTAAESERDGTLRLMGREDCVDDVE